MFGGIEKFQTDPHWHDLLLFHEYFHGDNGAGIGASHQTGWTGTVALLFLLGGAVETEPGWAVERAADAADVYEINTAVWLRRLGCTLGDVPARGVGRAGGAAGRRRLADGRVGAQPGRAGDRARPTRASTAGNRAALPDLRDEDVIGSPYCVRDYVVDERFGGPDALAARARSWPRAGSG